MSLDRKALFKSSRAKSASGSQLEHRVAALTVVMGDSKVGLLEKPQNGVNHDEINLTWDVLKDNPFNARFFYIQQTIEERAESIRKSGQLQAAAVAEDPDEPGTFFIIDGGYRKRALQHLGKPDMRCRPQQLKSKLDLYLLSREFNKEREGNSVLDDAFAWKKLIDEKMVESEEKLAAKLDMSWPNLNKTLKITDIPTVVVEYMCNHPDKFGLRTSYEVYLIHKAKGDVAAMDFAHQVVEDDLSAKKAQELREKLTQDAAKQRKPKETSRPWRILTSDGAEVGKLKEFDDSGRIVADLIVTDPDERRLLMAKLKGLFSIPSDS